MTKDPEKRKAEWASWYARNRDHVIAKAAKYRKKNREEINRKASERYYANHEATKARLKAAYHADRESRIVKMREWRTENPEAYRLAVMKSFIKRRYGLSWEAYQKILKTQKTCRLCGARPDGKGRNGSQLCVDHCHTSGKFRALLCRNCNSMLGLSRDNPKLLRKAAAYLEAHK